MAIQWKTLATALKASLTAFSNEDCYLVENDVNERSITHVLGCYLQRRIALHVSKVNKLTPGSLPKYKVDCEYNRFGPDERKWVPMGHEIDGGDELFYTPHPDIIIHDRGLWGHNLLVVEAKKRGRTDTLGRVVDKMKLAAYLFPPLRYKYGLFLCLGESQDNLLVEAKLVRQAAAEKDYAKVINKVWGPLHRIVVKSIDGDGKIKFHRAVAEGEDRKLLRLEDELEERCDFRDVLQQLAPGSFHE